MAEGRPAPDGRTVPHRRQTDPSRTDTTVGAWLAPLDRLRSRVLRTLAPLGARRLIRDRELRVALTTVTWIGVAALGAVTVPILMLALGPILLGVPHVLGDVRHLIVRRRYHQRRALVVLAGVPLVIAGLGGGLPFALAAVGGAILAARASARRRLLGLLVVGSLAALIARIGILADVLYAHAHNLVGVLLWWLWRPRIGGLHTLALIAFGGVFTALLLGAGDAVLATTGGLWLPGVPLHAERLARSLAPGASTTWSARILVAFAFAQSVHYLVWLRLVPEEDQRVATPRSFRASWRGLHADLGAPLLFLATAATLVVMAWATVDLVGARSGYLHGAVFHGQLELVALALLLVEGAFGLPASPAEAAVRRAR